MAPRKSAQPDVGTPVQSTASAPERNENISEIVQKGLARWTDEQEIVLLKGIVRWKPVGSSSEGMNSRGVLTFEMD